MSIDPTHTGKRKHTQDGCITLNDAYAYFEIIHLYAGSLLSNEHKNAATQMRLFERAHRPTPSKITQLTFFSKKKNTRKKEKDK